MKLAFQPDSSEQLDLPAAAIIAFISLILRVVWHLSVTPTDWPDTAVYAETGKALLATGQMTTPIYMPGYPLLLALFGYDGILWLQLVLSALTVAAVHQLSLLLFCRKSAARCAGLIAAVYPLFIFYSNMRLSETVFIFFFVYAVILGLRQKIFYASIAFVLSILIRPTIDYIVPVMIVLFVFSSYEKDVLKYLRCLAIYVVVYAVLMFPWWIHNENAYGHWVRLDLGDGIVMILENNPLFSKVGLDFKALSPVWEQFNNISDPIARNNAMKSAAWLWITNHPEEWLKMSGDRFIRFWSFTPMSPRVIVNIVGFISTFPVVVCALAALVIYHRRWRLFAPLLFVALWLTAVHTAFHGLPRYRLPLDPLMIALAGGVVGPATAALIARSRRRYCPGGPEGIEMDDVHQLAGKRPDQPPISPDRTVS